MGTRPYYEYTSYYGKDHPHAYGDKQALDKAGVSYDGSSPRVWGQGVHDCHGKQVLGIIPTRMGTSRIGFLQEQGVKDHPHAYGDKLFHLLFSFTSRGSSPRVWGQVFIAVFIPCISRIIPTRMGTSQIGKGKNGYKWDHPHAYGDKCNWWVYRKNK